MPRGFPTLGYPSRREYLDETMPSPAPEVLGVVKDTITDPEPSHTSASWQSESGEQVEVTAPPPPWELEDKEHQESDARRFIEVPKDWTVRWINPKLLDQFGWRYWQPVMASDPRVKVKVKSMVSVENNIRRGGQTGDILGWMYTRWVESRRKKDREETARLTQSAVDRQDTLREEFRRGTYGPYVSLAEAKHPSHTMAEGRSMKD